MHHRLEGRGIDLGPKGIADNVYVVSHGPLGRSTVILAVFPCQADAVAYVAEFLSVKKDHAMQIMEEPNRCAWSYSFAGQQFQIGWQSFDTSK